MTAEDHLYGDKERFVTAAYRKKLEEQQKWKEEQRRKCARAAGGAAEQAGLADANACVPTISSPPHTCVITDLLPPPQPQI